MLFINKLIDELKDRIISLNTSLKKQPADQNYAAYVVAKRNESIFQIEQLNQQVERLKACKNGDRFRLSVIDGTSTLAEGDSILSAISPVMVEVVDQKIQRIVS
ncbi:MAG: hypothetical protein VW397_06350 [Candidatus Margulisiibacteriota bacterium]